MKKNYLIAVILFFCIYTNQAFSAAPTIAAVQPQGGGSSLSSACTGQTIRLLGTNFLPPDLATDFVTINGTDQFSYVFINNATIELIIPVSTPSSGAGITYTSTGGTSSTYNFIINQSPSSADAYTAGNPNNFGQCQSSSFNMLANTPINGTGQWSCIAGCTGVSISNLTSPTTNVSNVPPQTSVVLNWTISNPGCVDSVSTVTIFNYNMPTTTGAIIGASNQDICITSPTTTLSGNNPSGYYTGVSWVKQSGPSSSLPSNPSSSSTPFTASAVGVYAFKYFISNGSCAGPSAGLTVTVHNSPTVSAGTPVTQCYGIPANIGGSSSNTTSLNWTLSGGAGTLNSTSIPNPTYTSAGSDAFGVSFTAMLYGSNPGCGSATSSVNISILAKPTAQINAGSTITICAGGTASIPINFTGTPPFSGLALFDGTSGTNLGTVSGSTYTASVSPTSTTNYTLSPVLNFKDNNNCLGTWSGSVNVAVNPAPSATISVSPAVICAGGSSTLNLTATGGGGPGWTIYYNSGGANTSMVSSGTSSIPVTPSGTTTYTIDSIQTSSCGKIKLTGINTLLTVNAPPTVSPLTLTVSDDTLCSGEATLVTISNVQANTIYKIIKNFNNNNLDSIIVTNTSPGTISINIPYSKFTHGSIDTLRFHARRPGCTPVFSFQKRSIWSSALVTPSIAIAPVSANCNKSILQENTPQAGVGYQWYEGNNMLVSNTTHSTTAYFPGSYTLVGMDTLLCTAPSNVLSINYDADVPLVGLSDISTTETKLTATTTAQHYRWFAQTSSGIKRIEGDTSNSISVYFDGNYFLGTYNNTCFFMSGAYTVSNRLAGSLLRQSFKETDSTIVLPKVDFTEDAKVYPNPVSHADFTVDYIAGDVTKVTFILYNPQGLAITQKEINGNGIIKTTIASKDLPPGIYGLFIYDGVKQIRKNIMIY
jgi:mucin-2